MPALTGRHLPLCIGLTCARCPRLVPARRKRFYDGRSDPCGGGGTARPVRTAPTAPARPAGIPSNKTIRTASSNRNSLGSREVNSKTSSAKKRAKATPRKALRKPTIKRSLHRVKRIPVPAPTTAPMIIKSRIVPSQGEAGRAIRKNATATTVIEAVPKTITSEAVRCPIRLGREISGLFSVAPTSNSEPFFECQQIAPDSHLVVSRWRTPPSLRIMLLEFSAGRAERLPRSASRGRQLRQQPRPSDTDEVQDRRR